MDQLVIARVVTKAGGDGHAGESPHDPAAAEKIEDRLPYGAEEKDDGPSS